MTILDFYIIALYLPVFSLQIAWLFLIRRTGKGKIGELEENMGIVDLKKELDKKIAEIVKKDLDGSKTGELNILEKEVEPLLDEITKKEIKKHYSPEEHESLPILDEFKRQIREINQKIYQINLDLEKLKVIPIGIWDGIPEECLEKVKAISIPPFHNGGVVIEKREKLIQTSSEERKIQKEQIWQRFDEFLAGNLQKIQKDRVEEEKRRIELEKQREKEEKYKNALMEAEKCFQEYLYKEAILLFEKALTIKPEEEYPKQMIQVAREKIATFKKFIDQAKEQERRGDFIKAKGRYLKASEIIPINNYPIQRIQFLEEKIRRQKEQEEQILQNKREKEKQEQERRDQFKSIIQKADEKFNSEEYEEAVDLYRQALEIYDYPEIVERVDRCLEKIKEAKDERERKQREFDQLKILADRLLNEGRIEEAISKLQQAKALFPKDSKVNKLIELYRSKLSELEEKKRLEALVSERKPNWEEFQKVLEQNGIKCFYHFTDIENIPSIIRHGGLFSWAYCKRERIPIPKPGGSPKSWELDERRGKEDFVRLAYTKEHPMLYIAMNDGRIIRPSLLEINIEIAYFNQTEFADSNAAAFRYTPKIGRTIQHLKNTRFDILQKGARVKHYNLPEDEKPYNQAEVLVKTWIPLKYILNINHFK